MTFQTEWNVKQQYLHEFTRIKHNYKFWQILYLESIEIKQNQTESWALPLKKNHNYHRTSLNYVRFRFVTDRYHKFYELSTRVPAESNRNDVPLCPRIPKIIRYTIFCSNPFYSVVFCTSLSVIDSVGLRIWFRCIWSNIMHD